MDRISSLPDGIIIHILSFLRIEEAASTSELSKRWRNMFAFSPNLCLEHTIFTDLHKIERRRFVEFVDRLLTVSGNSFIKRFSVRLNQKGSRSCDQAHINRWTCNVLNRGVLNLDLESDCFIDGGFEVGHSLPFETFTCKTLVNLQLTGFSINELPGDAILPALRTLFLSDVQFSSRQVCAFVKLLSSCPVLEALTISDLKWEQQKWPRLVSCPSLQRLTIYHGQFRYGSDFGNIAFDTPSLTYFYYFDHVGGFYPVVNIDSVVEANLHLIVTGNHTWSSTSATEDNHITKNPKNLIKGLRNVKIMNLVLHHCLERFYIFHEAIPVFKNLSHLSLKPTSERCWRALPFLLNKAPNLETLIIKGLLTHAEGGYGSSGYSCLLSCPVKVLKIDYFTGITQEVEHLKHLLGKLSCLELVKIRLSVAFAENQLPIAKNIVMLPRASSKCKVKIK